MPLRNGQKFACESCIRGHRGRPVKQCDHCRTARKSKSHHGQCDCGSKKDKKKEEKVEVKAEIECCCHKGQICMCGKAKSVEARMERSLKRPTHSVKSKTCHPSTSPDSKLAIFNNGHHKQRHNNLAHTSGAPYKVPRPHTLHGVSQFAKSKQELEVLDAIPRATDDLWLSMSSQSESPRAISRSNSNESLDEDPYSFDFDNHFATQSEMSRNRNGLTLDTVNERNLASLSYCDLQSVSYNQEPFSSLATSPNFATAFDWPTSATAFSPSDLPLMSPFNDLTQSISLSGDSTGQSAPGMTTTSSLTQESEIEKYPEFWSDSIQIRATPSSDERWVTTPVAKPTKPAQPRYSSSSTGTTVNVGASSGIIIPAGSDAFEDSGDWDFNDYAATQRSNEVAQDLNWLF